MADHRPAPGRWGHGSHDVVTLTAAERRAFDALERSRSDGDEHRPSPVDPPRIGPGSPMVERLCRGLTVATAVCTVGLLVLVSGALLARWAVVIGAVVLGAGLALLVPVAVAARRLVVGARGAP